MSVAVLDLRSNTKAGTANDPSPGLGVFFDAGELWMGPWQWFIEDGESYWGAPVSVSSPSYLSLGSDPAARMSASVRNSMADMLSLARRDLQDAPLFRVLLQDVLGRLADPSGVSSVKPIIMGRRGAALKLGEFGFYTERFDTSHPNFQSRLDVHWADYRRMRSSGVAISDLRRWTGHEGLDLFGREPSSSDLDLLIPPEYRDDGYSRPSTTLVDDFTDTNGTALDDHTPSGGGFTWATPTNGFTIQSNDALPDLVNTNTGRASASLSSADHFSEVSCTVAVPSNERFYAGPTIRYQSDAETFYYFRVHVNNFTWFNHMRKQVAGVDSDILGDTSTDYEDTAVDAYIEIVGSTLDVKVDSVSLGIGGTDTSITGNLLIGMIGRASTSVFHSFNGADFASGFNYNKLERMIGRPIGRGILRGVS
jgi:hypothetical protein